MAVTDDDEHRTAAELELVAGLAFFPRLSPRTWGIGRWREILYRLCPRERRVVVLRGVFGMGFQDIGERLGCSRARAHQLWYTAMDVIRPLIREEWVGGEFIPR